MKKLMILAVTAILAANISAQEAKAQKSEVPPKRSFFFDTILLLFSIKGEFA